MRFYTERGCAKRCSFCSVGEFFNGTVKTATPIDINATIRNLIQTTREVDVRHIVIGNLSMFNQSLADKEFVRSLRRSFDETGFELEWWCQTRGDLITREIAKLLADAGCKQVAIGCEAGTDMQLNHIRKGEKCDQIKRALEMLRENKIETQCYWVIGLPRDNADRIKKTQQAILSYLENDLTTLTHITILVPYPGTPVEAKPGNHGININHKRWGEYWMNCDPFGCGEPVYNTTDINNKILLKSNEIHESWLETICMVSEFYERKYPT